MLLLQVGPILMRFHRQSRRSAVEQGFAVKVWVANTAIRTYVHSAEADISVQQ